VQVAQRLLALAAGIWFNWQLGVADKPSMVAYDHYPPRPIRISHLALLAIFTATDAGLSVWN
jgi:hypothetical protein